MAPRNEATSAKPAERSQPPISRIARFFNLSLLCHGFFHCAARVQNANPGLRGQPARGVRSSKWILHRSQVADYTDVEKSTGSTDDPGRPLRGLIDHANFGSQMWFQLGGCQRLQRHNT